MLMSIAFVLGFLFPVAVHADGYYDLPITQWPVDTREYMSGFFWAGIDEAIYVNNQPSTFIYGWLGIFTAPPTATPGSGRFTQIRIMSENGQLYWVMETERQIKACLRGSTFFFTNGALTGCRGIAGDLINPNHEFNAVSIAHYDLDHQWVINVADFFGNGGPVATIDDGTVDGYYPGGTTYNAAQLAAEHYWENSYSSNPYNPMAYYFYAPHYGSSNDYWPSISSGVADYLDTRLDLPCNYVGVFYPNLSGDPHLWYLGTGGNTCSYTFQY